MENPFTTVLLACGSAAGRALRSSALLSVVGCLCPLVSAQVPRATADQLLTGKVAFTADITPAQITASQNDYNPTGLSTAAVLRLSTDASRNLTGLAGGADGRVVMIDNAGSFDLVLVNASASSTAANRFALDADYPIKPTTSALLRYDATASRWRLLGLTPTALALAYQPLDADLTAIAALGSTGFAVRTASNTWAQRTITGTAAEITVTNGDGVAGAPTLSLPTALTFTGKTITGGTYASPTLTTPVLGTPTSGTVTNLTGTASININGTVGATTPATGAFTTGVFSTSVSTPSLITASGALTIAPATSITNVTGALNTTGDITLTKAAGFFTLNSTAGRPTIIIQSLGTAASATDATVFQFNRFTNALPSSANVGEIRFDGLTATSAYTVYGSIIASTTGTSTATGSPSQLAFVVANGTTGVAAANLTASSLNVTTGTVSTSTISGALVLTGSGGLGVGGNTYIGGSTNISYSPVAAPGTLTGHTLLLLGTADASGTGSLRGISETYRATGTSNVADLIGRIGVIDNNLSVGTVGAQYGSRVSVRLIAAGATTTAYGYTSSSLINSSGHGVNWIGYAVESPTYASTGRWNGTTTGLDVQNIGHADTPTVTGVNIANQTKGSGNAYGIRSQMTAATGKWSGYFDGTAAFYVAGNVGLGTAATATSALSLPASTTGVSSLNLPHGTAPTSPVNGDIWTTTTGVFARINGGTVGYMGAAGKTLTWNHSLTLAGTDATTHTFPTTTSTLARTDAAQTFTGAQTFSSTITTLGGATFHTTSSALTNGAAAAAGTLTNAPAAGNPTKWIAIDDNGTVRYLPAW